MNILGLTRTYLKLKSMVSVRMLAVIVSCLIIYLYVLAYRALFPDPKGIPPPYIRSSMYETGFSDPADAGLANYIASRWIIGPSSYPLNLDEPDTFDFSQSGQSMYVDKLLNHRTGGFFVECGASAGENLSNTLFFERERGWTGLLVEANPHFFNQLVQKHRNAYLINACLSTSNTTDRLRFYPDSFWGGLNPGSQVQGPIEVQCFPLYSLLLALRQRHVDYLSLDVEGSELGILRTIPFMDVHIDVVGVEVRVNWPNNTCCDAMKTRRKLKDLRRFFTGLGGLYEEVGTLPWRNANNAWMIEGYSLDVFFKHT